MSRAVALALLVATVLAACGEGEREDSGRDAPPAGGPAMSHVHGVGLDPADRSVLVATHSGLFRAPEGEQRAARVGDLQHDLMGFTVAGPRRYLSSGHPDLSEDRGDLPPLLGLMRSTDGGRSWKPVSLDGRADFHVLRAAGDRVYGVNSVDGRLMASTDGGRSWERRDVPGTVIDLAPRPQRGPEVVASTDRGLRMSRDGGATWHELARGVGGLVARTSARALVVVDGDGAVHGSADAGRTFERVGDVGGQPSALSAAAGELYVALHTSEVKLSRDGGRTWELRVRPS